MNPPPISLPIHLSGSSPCTSPKHAVSCIGHRLAIRFLLDSIHVSVPFSQIIRICCYICFTIYNYFISSLDLIKFLLILLLIVFKNLCLFKAKIILNYYLFFPLCITIFYWVFSLNSSISYAESFV